jgi:hypothetical protein
LRALASALRIAAHTVGSVPRILAIALMASSLPLAGIGTLVSAAPRAAPAAAAAAIILDRLVIRMYDNAGLTTRERARAMSRADAILRRADVDVEWIDCPARKFGRPSPICDLPPARDELVVRLVVAPKGGNEGSKWLALGYSLIDTTAGTGTLATIYLDRVTGLAGVAGLEVATVLARALAHEIGHLVLGSNDHSDAGIMRETWTTAQLTSAKPQDWLFLPAEAERLRQARLTNAGERTADASLNPKTQFPNPKARIPNPEAKFPKPKS